MAGVRALRLLPAFVVVAALLMVTSVAADSPLVLPATFSKHLSGPVLSRGSAGEWDATGVYSSSVDHDGSMYRMWYTSYAFEGMDATVVNRIGLATSADGVVWTKTGAPVFGPDAFGAWDGQSVYSADVLGWGGHYTLYYSGRDVGTSVAVHQIGAATSTDGITWTRHPDNPLISPGAAGSWDAQAVQEPTVVRDSSGRYHMWYLGRDAAYNAAVGYATSPDGFAWTKHSANPVFFGAAPPSEDVTITAIEVTSDGQTYYMWYVAANQAGTGWETFLATSSDGVNWSRRGKVLAEGTDGSYDRWCAGAGSVLLVDGAYRLWYTAMGSDYRNSIGYASAPALLANRNAYLPLLSGGRATCDPLWSDDFSDYHSGWTVGGSGNPNHSAYVDGEYQLSLSQPGWITEGFPGLPMEDGVLAVDVRFTPESSQGGRAGIAFGISWETSAPPYYTFEISAEGTYHLERWTAGSGPVELASGTVTGFLGAAASNHLSVERNGSLITVAVNGAELTTASDATHQGALRVGLAISSEQATGAVDARFDNFALYEAGCLLQ